MLTQQLLLELLSYDPETGNLTWKPRQRASFKDDRSHAIFNTRYANQPAFTAVGKHGYKVGSINNQLYRAHRIIWIMVHGNDPDQIDHINGIRTDNRINNLREVTGKENQKNMKRPVNNTSGHVGVAWDASKNSWLAFITVNRKRLHLGRFKEFEDAIAARKAAETANGFHRNHGR